METNESRDDLVQLVYASAAKRQMDRAGLMKILGTARSQNAERGVTGMLLYEDGSFLQVLEGPREAVGEVFEKITRDTRHNRIIRILTEKIDRRNFSDWSMGLADVTKRELRAIPGLNDFFQDGRSYTDLDPGQARLLLESFREGIWRASPQ